MLRPHQHIVSDSWYVFGNPERPDICSTFQASEDVCGSSKEEAVSLLKLLERKTKPDGN
jgi:hypothetical protein